jgi:maltooligosyltrehalose trehalohydrolase
MAITLLAPMPPLLFMGDEWGSKRPFPFFCDFQGDLAEAVRKGRRAEFKDAYAQLGDDIPDPLDDETFQSAILDWYRSDSTSGQAWLSHVRGLLSVRAKEIAPRLSEAAFISADWHGSVLTASWWVAKASLNLIANLTATPAERPQGVSPIRPIWGGTVPETLPPWSVYWDIGEA